MNPYKVLQVDRDAEPEVIEAAYRRLVSKYHPDRNHAPEAPAILRDVNAAYELLRDAERRATYDRTSFESQPPFAPGSFRPPPSEEEPAFNPVFRNVLVVGGLLTFLVYRPVMGAVLGALTALVWLAWSRPGALGKWLKGLALAAGALVLAFGVDQWLSDRATARELAGLTVEGLLAQKLAEAQASCLEHAPGKAEQGRAYCACLSRATRDRFDASPVHADNATDYRRAVDARFQAAAPTEDNQAACLIASVGSAR